MIVQNVAPVAVGPDAKGLIHHGGIGSVLDGLSAGIPAIALPQGLDQFDNANRLRRLGAGAWIKPSAQSGSLIAETLEGLLADPAALNAASAWRQDKSAVEGQDIPGIMRTAFGIPR